MYNRRLLLVLKKLCWHFLYHFQKRRFSFWNSTVWTKTHTLNRYMDIDSCSYSTLKINKCQNFNLALDVTVHTALYTNKLIFKIIEALIYHLISDRNILQSPKTYYNNGLLRDLVVMLGHWQNHFPSYLQALWIQTIGDNFFTGDF